MSDGTLPVGGGAFPPCILLKLLDLSKLLDGFLNVVTHMDLSKKLYGFVYVVTWICQSCYIFSRKKVLKPTVCSGNQRIFSNDFGIIALNPS